MNYIQNRCLRAKRVRYDASCDKVFTQSSAQTHLENLGDLAVSVGGQARLRGAACVDHLPQGEEGQVD
jgi:hypothetical protein